MMSPNLLARASSGFRCGYNDALNERGVRTSADYSAFWNSDYLEGYSARITEVRLEREDALRREYGDTRMPRLAITPRR